MCLFPYTPLHSFLSKLQILHSHPARSPIVVKWCHLPVTINCWLGLQPESLLLLASQWYVVLVQWRTSVSSASWVFFGTHPTYLGLFPYMVFHIYTSGDCHKNEGGVSPCLENAGLLRGLSWGETTSSHPMVMSTSLMANVLSKGIVQCRGNRIREFTTLMISLASEAGATHQTPTITQLTE